MMLTLLSPLVGIFGSLLPSVVRFFERKQELKHDLEIAKVQAQSADKAVEVQLLVESYKASVADRESVRTHDSSIVYNGFTNTLRATIRPIITYCFFILFVAIKVSAAYVMISSGIPMAEMLSAVWDTETASLFATIMAFWFGSRQMEKMEGASRSYYEYPIDGTLKPSATVQPKTNSNRRRRDK